MADINHPCQILSRLVKGLGDYGSKKTGGFPLTLNVALTTVLRTNVVHCDKSKFKYFQVSSGSAFIC